MAKHRSNARLFQADGYTFRCWIDPEEAQERFERGELDVTLHPVTREQIGFRIRESYQVSDPARMRPSQSSITLTEMLLNVGLSSKSSDQFPNPKAVEDARLKICVWPFVWDEQATIVKRI